jgi:RIO kinase 1
VDKELYHHLDSQIDKLRTKRKGAQDRKTEDEVFDRSTLLAIYDLMASGIVETVDFPISTGKEGNVFRATSPSGTFLALKIYRTATANFNAIRMYIVGDSRFKGIEGSKRKVIMAWSHKEFRNLELLYGKGVRVPKPIKFSKNVVAMEYIGTDEQPAPMLKSVVLEDPRPFFDDIVENMRKAYVDAGLIHADMSEYNILIRDGIGVIIDVGQAVMRNHPNAQDFLKRDVYNIVHYFSKLGVKCDAEGVLARVKGEKL